MKNLFALLCVLAVIGTANAVFLTDNGDFEATGPGEGWGVWAGGGAVASENLSGGNPSQYVSIDCGTLGWAGWFNQDGVGGELNVLGIPAGETVTVACDIKSLGGALNVGGLKPESWAGGVGGASADPLAPNVLFTITTSWANYSTDYTLTTDATELVVSMMNLASDFGTPADIGFDNITVDAGGRALRPIPSVGFGYAATATSVSWENPAGATSVAAYLLESDVPLNDPNMGPTIFEPGVVTLTVDGGLESATVSLLDDKYYYWAVHVDGVQGYVWDFQTLDSPPTADAGVDQYLETTGTGMVLSLDGTVTDDGTPTITWTDITVGTDKDPDTLVTINSASTEDTTVTLTNGVSGAVTGYYQFQIAVDDGINPVETDTVAIGVYPTCAAAAAADPADGWASVGDIDGDCKANLTDFALFAAAWLDCNSNRVTCP